MTVQRWFVGCLVAFVLSVPKTAVAQLPPTNHTVPDTATSFLENHCLDCHGPDDPAGGLDINALSADLHDEASQAQWIRIHDRVARREMPPAAYDQPQTGDRRFFVDGLHKRLTTAHAAQKGTVLRRLNRREYENTLNDLFGTHVPLVSTLPE